MRKRGNELKNYSEITPYINELAELSCRNNNIVNEMYIEHEVYRGLRDTNGKGVVTGLTEVSKVMSRKIDENGNEVQCPGELGYRGYDIKDLVGGFMNEDRFGFEETIYLLLFSELPTKEQLEKGVLINFLRLSSFTSSMKISGNCTSPCREFNCTNPNLPQSAL